MSLTHFSALITEKEPFQFIPPEGYCLNVTSIVLDCDDVHFDRLASPCVFRLAAVPPARYVALPGHLQEVFRHRRVSLAAARFFPLDFEYLIQYVVGDVLDFLLPGFAVGNERWSVRDRCRRPVH